jgi:endonuclease YncB( thermonuclease family)
VKRTSALLLVAVIAFGLPQGCTPVGGQRYSRAKAQKSLAKLEAPGLKLGEFTLTRVVDGDTVRVDGLDSSLRLVGMDSEETFKSEADRRAVETNWNTYVQEKRSKGRPSRMATPMGEVAKEWAKKFFDGAGVWVNFNVEAVRAGMSPYYTKYGYSRRFHKEFREAQAQAQAAKRGIWASGIMNYPDYPERFAWWTPRADFIDEFRAAGEGKDNFIDISQWDALANIEAHVGKEVNILGTVGDVRIGERGPSRVTLSRAMFADFPLVVFDRDLLGTTGLAQWKGEYVWITGIPTIYENKNTHRKQVQVVIERASQVKLSHVPGLTPPSIGGNSP